jgi:hypothetical protein
MNLGLDLRSSRDYEGSWPSDLIGIWFIDQARHRVRNYEQYEIRFPAPTNVSNQGTRTNVPSPHWAKFLNDDVENSERRKGEVEFRTAFALISLLPATILIIQGGVIWIIAFAPIVLVSLDRWILQGRTGSYLKVALTEELQREISNTKRALAGKIAEQNRRAQLEQKLAELQSIESQWSRSRGMKSKSDFDQTISRLKETSKLARRGSGFGPV